jgi:hypothetical protein
MVNCCWGENVRVRFSGDMVSHHCRNVFLGWGYRASIWEKTTEKFRVGDDYYILIS